MPEPGSLRPAQVKVPWVAVSLRLRVPPVGAVVSRMMVAVAGTVLTLPRASFHQALTILLPSPDGSVKLTLGAQGVQAEQAPEVLRQTWVAVPAVVPTEALILVVRVKRVPPLSTSFPVGPGAVVVAAGAFSAAHRSSRGVTTLLRVSVT